MQLEILREFLAVSIIKNFSEAAKTLNTSQPSLSRHIDMLEKELKCKLILRTKPISLTPQGVRIRSYANDILQTYSEMIEYAKNSRKITASIISIHDISFSPLPYDFLSRCENRFIADNPTVSFRHMTPKPGRSYWEVLEQGDLDIGWVYGYSCGDDIAMVNVPSSLEIVPVPAYRGELCLALNKNNPLLNKRSGQIELADCRELKFMSKADRHLDHFRKSFSKFCQRFGGFKPLFDFRESENSKDFYSSNQGNSAHICANYGDNDNPLLTTWVSEQTEYIKFDKYYSNTFAVFLKTRKGTDIERFVNDYLCKPLSLGHF
jgi:DNA-binding transcriptional LysR family regulator